MGQFANNFYWNDAPIQIVSVGYEDRPGEMFYALYHPGDKKFLHKTYRPNLRKNWTIKVQRASLFKSQIFAEQFAKQHFTNVTICE